MPARNFINNNSNSKFEFKISYRGLDYDCTIYIAPFTTQDEIDDIIKYFGNRKYKGKLCLDTDEEIIRKTINDNDVSAFFIVSVSNINNVASGTLQIYNWCKTKKGPDVWINDVCKISPDDVISQEKTTPGSTGAPVEVMFMLMEQLAVQNLGKRNIKLFVENDPIENARFLVPRYQRMGFQIDDVCGKKFPDETVMEKQVNPDTTTIDFSFLTQRVIGGKKKTNKKKIKKNKTYKKRKC